METVASCIIKRVKVFIAAHTVSLNTFGRLVLNHSASSAGERDYKIPKAQDSSYHRAYRTTGIEQAGDQMIKFENVCKKYDINGKETVIIDDVSLTIEEKEIFGLVGETASGKSTILRMMTGFIEPDRGNIYLMGKKLDKQSRHELVKDTSMIFQSFNLLGNLNVLDNVLLPTKLRKGDKQVNLKRARELLWFVGLADYESAYIRSLSGGQKQRVAIARTLMTNPRIIFCDEPTSALDEMMSYEILKLLKKINEQFGTTIVLVSHDIWVIKTLCQRVAIIEDGKISDIVTLAPRKIAPVSYKEALLRD